MGKVLLSGLSADQQKQRRHKLGLIHKAKAELGFDDDFYRDLLQQITGQKSAKNLTLKELDAVINHLRSRGWQTGDRSPRSSHLPVKRPQHRIVAKWIELAKNGKIKDGSDYALQQWVVRFLGPKHSRAICLPGVRPLDVLSDKQCFKVFHALKKIEEWEPKQGADPEVRNGE